MVEDRLGARPLVGPARRRNYSFLRPDLQIHLHRFLIRNRMPFATLPTEPALVAIDPNPAEPRSAAVTTARPFAASARKRLFLAVTILLCLLVALNIMIDRTARTSLRHQMLTRLETIPADTDCIFLGNSLVEAGCDVPAFLRAWPDSAGAPKAVNLALGATSPVEHYLILKKALEKPLKVKYLIYGFFDDQLNAAADGNWSDLVGNRAFSYYFPRDAAELYAPGSVMKRWQLELTARIPMLSERSSLWGKVEKLRRKFEDVGVPPQKSNRFGRVADFAALEAVDVPSFNRRCSAVVTNQQGFSPALQRVINLAHEHGAQVILLEMPMPSRHRTVFYSSSAWSNLQAYLRSLALQQKAVYLAASDWVKDDADFEDVTHLNEQGAKVFSAQLAQAIARLGRAHLVSTAGVRSSSGAAEPGMERGW